MDQAENLGIGHAIPFRADMRQHGLLDPAMREKAAQFVRSDVRQLANE